MVQKSILSFFGTPKAKASNNDVADDSSSKKKSKEAKSTEKKKSKQSVKEKDPDVSEVEDSPVKKKSRRRIKVVDSDSEDEAPVKKVSKNKIESDDEQEQASEPESDKENKSKADSNAEAEESDEEMETDSSPVKKQNKSDNFKDKLKKFHAPEFLEISERPPRSPKPVTKQEEPKAAGSSTPRVKGTQKRDIPGFTEDTVPPKRNTAKINKKRKGSDDKSSSDSKKVKTEMEENSSENIEDAEVKEKESKNSKNSMDCNEEKKTDEIEEKDIKDNENEEKEMNVKDKESDDTEQKQIKKENKTDLSQENDKKTKQENVEVKSEPMDTETEEVKSPKKDSDKEDVKLSPKKSAFNKLFSPKSSTKSKDKSIKEEPFKTPKEKQSSAKTSESDKKSKSPDKTPDNKSTNKSTSPSKSETSPNEKKPAPKKIGINPFAPKVSTGPDPGVDYNPAKSKYHPIDDAFWKKGEKVPYLALAKTMEIIEETSGRLKTIEILANLLRSVIVLSPDDMLHCIYLCLNKVAPAFTGIELMVGDTILMKAIAQTTGRSVERIKNDVNELGDLGLVAEQSRSNQRMMMQPAKLTVNSVFMKLKDIASMTGTASQSKKVDKIKGMFVACRYSEARFIIRSLTGKLRIGLAEQSVLQAIGQACYLTPPGQEYPPPILNAGKGLSPESLKAKIEEKALIVKTTYCECPSYDEIIPVILKEGVDELPKHCKLSPGVPLKPMLAHPTKGISEVLKRFENAKFTCEYKYDGERAQIHLHEDGTINIYSRNQEDNTTKYPDIISRFKNSMGEDVKSCVIDSEAVAWDREKQQILPFQILSTRKRKDANESDIKVQVCVFPFDLLYFNGKALVKEPFENRRKLLRDNFKEVEGEFTFAKSMDSTDLEDIQVFLDESIKGNCEGLMVKTLDIDATYEIAKRSHNWLKVKKDYLDGVGDTLDLVVLGGYLGKGKRAGHYGGFLLGCYDPDNEEFQTICKIGTGFTDEDLQTHSAFFKDHKIEKAKSYYRYENSLSPDHWFDAVQVWEVKCADLSISPVHKAAAGLVDPEKGISLRFPRFLRIRDDKSAEQATSSSQVAELYNNQDQIKNKTTDVNEEDFY